MVLSMTCNWCFANFNDKFRPSTEFAPSRLLQVYCNVGTSSMVGNRVTDLLREIKYQSQGTTHFEPIHIQYLPVRNELVEIIETQMAEVNGDAKDTERVIKPTMIGVPRKFLKTRVFL